MVPMGTNIRVLQDLNQGTRGCLTTVFRITIPRLRLYVTSATVIFLCDDSKRPQKMSTSASEPIPENSLWIYFLVHSKVHNLVLVHRNQANKTKTEQNAGLPDMYQVKGHILFFN